VVGWSNNRTLISCGDELRHRVAVAAAVALWAAVKQWSWCRGAARVLKSGGGLLDFHLI
jgi:hypothetical protein